MEKLLALRHWALSKQMWIILEVFFLKVYAQARELLPDI